MRAVIDAALENRWGNRGILIVVDEVHGVNRLAQRANCLALGVTSPSTQNWPGQILVLSAIGASRTGADFPQRLLSTTENIEQRRHSRRGRYRSRSVRPNVVRTRTARKARQPKR
jgi:hypothetical protein